RRRRAGAAAGRGDRGLRAPRGHATAAARLRRGGGLALARLARVLRGEPAGAERAQQARAGRDAAAPELPRGPGRRAHPAGAWAGRVTTLMTPEPVTPAGVRHAAPPPAPRAT